MERKVDFVATWLVHHECHGCGRFDVDCSTIILFSCWSPKLKWILVAVLIDPFLLRCTTQKIFSCGRCNHRIILWPLPRPIATRFCEDACIARRGLKYVLQPPNLWWIRDVRNAVLMVFYIPGFVAGRANGSCRRCQCIVAADNRRSRCRRTT